MICRSSFFVGLLIIGALILAVLYLKEEMPHAEDYLPPIGVIQHTSHALQQG